MRRDPGLLMEAVDHADQSILLLEPKISNTLNTSQKRACATILSPHFREGFFLIQGP